MAALILPNRFTQQPQIPVPLAGGSTVGAGLAHAWMLNVIGARALLDSAGAAHGLFGSGTGGTSGNTWNVGPQGYYLGFSDAGTGSVDSAILSIGGAAATNCAGPASDVFSIQARVRFGSQPGWNQCVIGSAINGVSLRVDSSNKLQLLKSGVAVMAASTVNVPMGVDVDLGCSYDGATARLYIDGVLVASAAAVQTFSKVQYALGSRGIITPNNITSNERLSNDSRIYLCAVWNRARSSSEFSEFALNPWQVFQAPARRVFAVTGTGPIDLLVYPVSASLDVSGYAPAIAVTANLSAVPGAGKFDIAGYPPALARTANQSASPANAKFKLASFAPALTQTAGTAFSPTVVALELNSYAPSILQPNGIAANAVAMEFAGYAPTLTQAITTTVAPGAVALEISSYAPALARTANASVSPRMGGVKVSGYAPALSQSVSQVISWQGGQLRLSGYRPSVVQSSGFPSHIPTTRLVRFGAEERTVRFGAIKRIVRFGGQNRKVRF